MVAAVASEDPQMAENMPQAAMQSLAAARCLATDNMEALDLVKT